MPSHSFLKDSFQPSFQLSDDSQTYPEFGATYGGLEQFPENRSPDLCFHPRSPHYHEFLQLVGGYSLHEEFVQVACPSLEGYIPQVFPRNARGVPIDCLGSFAVQYHQLPYLFSERFEPETFMRTGRWPRRVVIVVTGNSKDPRIEKVWDVSYRQPFWDSLARLPNVLLIAPDFSVYTHYSLQQKWRQGRFEHRFNIKRSFDFCRRASLMGLPCALPVTFAISRDLEILCDCLSTSGAGISLLSLNIQTQPETASLQPQLILDIENRVGRQFRWIVQGIGEENGFRCFRDAGLLGRTSFISSAEQVLAFKRRDIYKSVCVSADPATLLISNIAEKRKILSNVVKGIFTLPMEPLRVHEQSELLGLFAPERGYLI